jgi:hypothetical protein
MRDCANFATENKLDPAMTEFIYMLPLGAGTSPFSLEFAPLPSFTSIETRFLSPGFALD